jgi:hypothetical protein
MAKSLRLVKSPNIQGQIERVRDRAEEALQEIGRQHAARREAYVSGWTGMDDADTWEGGATNNKPDFPVAVTRSQTGLRLIVGLEGEPAESSTQNKLVYELLRDGTATRKVKMTFDFQRKTQPNSLASGAGQGGRARLTNTDFGSIAPRNQDDIINEALAEMVAKLIERAYKQG